MTRLEAYGEIHHRMDWAVTCLTKHPNTPNTVSYTHLTLPTTPYV